MDNQIPVPQLAGMSHIKPEVLTKIRDLIGDSDTPYPIAATNNVGLSTLTMVLSNIQPTQINGRIQGHVESMDTYHVGVCPIRHVPQISRKITTTTRWIARYPERMADLTAPPRITESSTTRVGDFHGAYLGVHFHVPRVLFMDDGDEFFDEALVTLSSGIAIEYKDEVLSAIRGCENRRLQNMRVQGSFNNPHTIQTAVDIYKFGQIHIDGQGFEKLTANVIRALRNANNGVGNPQLMVIPEAIKMQTVYGNPALKENFRVGATTAEGIRQLGPDFISNMMGISQYVDIPTEVEGKSDTIRRDNFYSRFGVGLAWYSEAGREALDLFVNTHSYNNTGGNRPFGNGGNGTYNPQSGTAPGVRHGSMTDRRAIRLLNPNIGNLNWDIVTLKQLIENCVALDQSQPQYLPLRMDKYENLCANYLTVLEDMGATVPTTEDGDPFVDPFIYFDANGSAASVAKTWGQVDRAALDDAFVRNWAGHTLMRLRQIVGDQIFDDVLNMMEASNISYSGYKMGSPGDNFLPDHVAEAFVYAVLNDNSNNRNNSIANGRITRNQWGCPNLPAIMPEDTNGFSPEIQALKVAGVPSRSVLVKIGNEYYAIAALNNNNSDFDNTEDTVGYRLVRENGGGLQVSAGANDHTVGAAWAAFGNPAGLRPPPPAADLVRIPEHVSPPGFNNIACLKYIAENYSNGGYNEGFKTWMSFPRFRNGYAKAAKEGITALEKLRNVLVPMMGIQVQSTLDKEYQNDFLREDMVPSYLKVDENVVGQQMARQLNQLYAMYSNVFERQYKFPLYVTLHNWQLPASLNTINAYGEDAFGQFTEPQLQNLALNVGLAAGTSPQQRMAFAGGFQDVLNHPERYNADFYDDFRTGAAELKMAWSAAANVRLLRANDLGSNTFVTLGQYLNAVAASAGANPAPWVEVRNVLANFWEYSMTPGRKPPIDDNLVRTWKVNPPRVANRAFQRSQARVAGMGAGVRINTAGTKTLAYIETGLTISPEFLSSLPVNYQFGKNIDGFVNQHPFRPSDIASYGFAALEPRILPQYVGGGGAGGAVPYDVNALKKTVSNLRSHSRAYASGSSSYNLNQMQRSAMHGRTGASAGTSNYGNVNKRARAGVTVPQHGITQSAAYTANQGRAVPMGPNAAEIPMSNASGGIGYGLMNPHVIATALQSKHFVYRYKMADSIPDNFERAIMLLFLGTKIYGRKMIDWAGADICVPLSFCLTAPWIEFEMWAVMYLNWGIGSAEYSMSRTNASYDPGIEYMAIDVRFYLGAFIDNMDDVFVADCAAYKRYVRGWDLTFMTEFAVTGTNSRNEVDFNIEDYDNRKGSMIVLYYPGSGTEPKSQVFCLSGKATNGYMSQFYSGANGQAVFQQKSLITYACAPYFCLISNMHKIHDQNPVGVGNFEDQLDFQINVIIGRGAQIRHDQTVINSGFGPLSDLRPGVLPIINGGIGLINDTPAMTVNVANRVF